MNFVIEIIYREDVTVRKSNSHFPFSNDNVVSFFFVIIKNGKLYQSENCVILIFDDVLIHL